MRTLLFLATLALTFTAAVREASADGGAIRLMETRDQLQVTVFTSPTPLRAGDVDVSVLVQDGAAPRTEQEFPIEVVATARDGSSRPILTVATKAAASNKLLQAAKFKLPYAGAWRIDVNVRLPDAPQERFSFDADIAPALSRWLTFWPWFSWPVVVVVLFVLQQRSARIKARAPAMSASPGSRSDT